MKINTFPATMLLLGLALTAAQTLAVQNNPSTPTKTISNLQAAYLGETTARAKYAVYAKAADRAGYKEAAQLFRAASEAEKTHARNHKQVLAKLEVTGLKEATYLKLPGATRENLADAIKGESYEIETMYPTMIQQAREEGQTDAERSMYYALSAEKQHVALFKDALKNLSRKPSLEAFYVCPVCGATYTMRNVPAASPVCGTPKAQFKLVR